LSLLHKAGYRHLLRHPWQLLLSVLGITMGVAVVVAMDLGIDSAREAFRASSEAVAGRGTHQIVGGVTGVPDSLPALLRREQGIRFAAPVLEGYVLSPDRSDRPLRVLGVDPYSEEPFRPFLAGGPGHALDGSLLLTEPGGVFLSRETADLLGISQGDGFRVLVGGAEGSLRAVGVLEPVDELSRRGLRDLLVLDIAEAQDLLDRQGRLDRVDLLLPAGAVGDTLLSRIQAVLPPGSRVEPAGSRDQAMVAMIQAFDLNLRALSLLALLFGIFLIYGTMTFSVVRRRTTLGILRAMGASRRDVLRSVLGEAAVLGALGAVPGVLLGVILGRGLVRLVTRTINDLYFVVSVEGVVVPPEVLLKGFVLGVGASVLASVPAVREAIRVEPREAMARASLEDRARKLVPRTTLLGLGLGLAGLLVLGTGKGILTAFVGLFAVIVGMALLTPAAVVGMTGALRPLLRVAGGIVGAMAARGVVTALSRTGPAMMALVVAVSVTVGLGVMIQSFRTSVATWLDRSLEADLYVSAPSVVAARPYGQLPRALAEEILALGGVDAVHASRGTQIFLDDGTVQLSAWESLGREGAGTPPELLASVGTDAIDRFLRGEGVLVSEPFATRRGTVPGDTVTLPGEDGPLPLPVLAVYRDYGSDAGAIRVIRSLYDRHWDDPTITSLGIFLASGADEARVEEEIRTVAGAGLALEVRSNQALRAASLEVFDRTFAITRVLRILAFVVAFMAVLSALMALQLERGRELAVLRANGLTPGQTWGLVTTQTGVMGAMAGILATPVGLALAAIMIQVVNRRSFGWSMEMVAGPELFLQAIGLAAVAALLAGVYPSHLMSRTSPAGALRGE
jgi:putative ABC transport system permease protein